MTTKSTTAHTQTPSQSPKTRLPLKKASTESNAEERGARKQLANSSFARQGGCQRLFAQRLDSRAQFENLDGAVGPVVFPAHEQVAVLHAERAVLALRSEGYRVEVTPDGGSQWVVSAVPERPVAKIAAAGERLEALAAWVGGEFLGHGGLTVL